MEATRSMTEITILFIVVYSLMISNNTFATRISSDQHEISKISKSTHDDTEVTRTNKTDLLVLVPTGINLTHLPLNLDDFQLLKLDGDTLFGADHESLLSSSSDSNATTDDLQERERRDGGKIVENRQARKFNILKGMWNKPKVSPLYLVNGTVCRFVNAVPICTTLATTGLIPNNIPNRQPTANQFGTATNTVQLTNNQQQQQFRPAAIMNDETQDIYVNVESGSMGQNSTTDTLINNNNNNRPQRQPVPQRQQQLANNNQYTVVQPARPFNFLINRRPIAWRN